MAIGDNLSIFTPELAAAGIRLIPSGNTDPIRPALADKTNVRGPGNTPPPASRGTLPFQPLAAHQRGTSLLLGSPPQAGSTAVPPIAGLSAPPAGRGVPNLSGVTPRGPGPFSLLSPDEVRPLNPFDPNQRVAPEDDALTPPGVLAPSEIKRQGDFFSKIGDFLGSPGFPKLLASIGASISGPDELTEFVIGTAEAKARGQFEQRLEAGESAADIDIFGLSTEGREDILARRTEAERVAGAESRADRQLDINAGNLAVRQSESNAAEDQQVLDNILSGQKIDLAATSEARLSRQAGDIAAFRNASLQIRRDELASLDAYRRAQAEGDSGSILDRILRLRQTAEAIQEQLESHREGIFGIEDELRRAENKSRSIGRTIADAFTPGDGRAAFIEKNTADIQERLEAAKDLETSMQESITNLTNAASTALGIKPVTPEDVAARRQTEFSSVQEAQAAGKVAGDRVIINGQEMILQAKQNQ